MNYNQLFADHITTYRKSRGLTQEEFAEKVGTSREVLSAYETARRGITLKTLLKWAIRLNVEPSKLIPNVGRR